MSCCPAGSLGASKNLSTAIPSGKKISITPDSQINNSPPTLQCYITGATLSSTNLKRIIIIFTDVFGPDGGNHKAIADSLVERLGSDENSVIIPDLFHGDPIAQPISFLPDVVGLVLTSPWMVYRAKFKNSPERVENDINNILLPWIKSETKCSKIDDLNLSCIGFCFGGWVNARCLVMPNSPFKCAIGIHPSIDKMEKLHGGSAEDIFAKVAASKKPMLMLPAGNDPNTYKFPGGEYAMMLKEGRGKKDDDDYCSEEDVSITFPDMAHGWVSRGDSSNENILANQNKALELTVNFIKKHCSN